MLKDIIFDKGVSIYKLSKKSGVAYTTLNDLCNGRTSVKKCSVETIYKIAQVLDVTMESIISPYIEKRVAFDIFKSNTCHRLKELGDFSFMIELLENDDIRKYYNKKWYAESLYLLAMLDYLSRINDIPYCNLYDDLRNLKMEKTLYPSSILVLSEVENDENVLTCAINESIPEFIRFNIVEKEIRNVV